ncbi:MAG: DUF5666 domain-containing protein [Syntrophales bacterium]|jgi:hypothetical protein|nr:DUF5666 domain-containing protein [Syntrophales bacterium]
MQGEQSLKDKITLLLKKSRLFLPLFFLLSGIVSCGGGGDLLAGGGIGGTGNTSVGPITALGSIFVNGVEFQTTDAAVTINGVNSNEKELYVGMVVQVEGTVNADGKTGKADRVIFSNNAAGPISSIDLNRSVLEIMGQTVLVDAQTIIAGLPGNNLELADLAANDMVEISGLADADGKIIATRISLKPIGRQFEVSGRISAPTAATFKINALTVDYSMAMLVKFGHGGIQAGDIVDVKGHLASSTVLLADVIEKKSPELSENSTISCEGFIDTLYYADQAISGFTIITQFGLQRVGLDGATIFTDGQLIKAGVRVKVDGTIKNNIIQAGKVDLLESMKMKGGAAVGMGSSLNGL